jgi:hypothetical protein
LFDSPYLYIQLTFEVSGRIHDVLQLAAKLTFNRLPHNSHHFTSAVTLLLRCAIQTSNDDTRRQCMNNARLLVDFLRKAKEEHDWDLSEECLTTSEPVLNRIENALLTTKFANNPYVPPAQQQQQQQQQGELFHDPTPTFEDSLMPGRFDAEAGLSGDISQMSIEILFPEIFAEFTDIAMLSTYHTSL